MDKGKRKTWPGKLCVLMKAWLFCLTRKRGLKNTKPLESILTQFIQHGYSIRLSQNPLKNTTKNWRQPLLHTNPINFQEWIPPRPRRRQPSFWLYALLPKQTAWLVENLNDPFCKEEDWYPTNPPTSKHTTKILTSSTTTYNSHCHPKEW